MGASQEIKVKINESRLMKLYQENSTKNFAEKKNLKKRPKFKEQTFLLKKKKKKKKKKKILNFKELCFPGTLSDKFQQIALKFATLYLFYPFLSCFFV